MESQISSDVEKSILDMPEDEKALGGHPPLLTVLYLSIGPLVQQIINALYSLIDTIYVAKALGQDGVEVYGAVFVVEFFAIAIAQFLSAGLSVRLSYLIGTRNVDECSQLYVDFLRLSIIFGILIPCCVLPITKPFVKWFGANESLSERCFQYMIPHSGLCLFNNFFMTCCGVLQATGRSITYAIVQVAAFVINIGCIDPIFLFVLKLPIWCASLATVLSQGIVGTTLIIMFFTGKFDISPKGKMFFSKFSKETSPALRLGLSTLVENLSLSLPLLLLQKYFNSAATEIHEYDNCITSWAIVEKLYLLIGGVCIGFSQGFLPAATYAYGARQYRRYTRLMLHSLWLSTLWSTVFSAVVILFPRQIVSFWSTDKHFQDIAVQIVPVLFYTALTLGIQYVVPCALQSMLRVFLSTTLSVLTLLLPMPVFSTILYFTGDGKKNPRRMMFTYTFNDVYAVILCFLFAVVPIYKLLKLKDGEANFDSKEKNGNYETLNGESLISQNSYTA